MVKGFTSREKEYIRESLLEGGKELFSLYGLKKTRIKDLTDKVGIAQGSFYNFFNSKEELYFEVIEREEERIKNSFIENKVISGDLNSEMLSKFLAAGFNLVDNNPIIKEIISGDEYNSLLRKLPPEKVAEHIENDTDVLRPFIESWQKEGLIIEENVEVISGLLRGLFTISLHKKEIGEDIYPDVIRLLIHCISTGLLKSPGNEYPAKKPHGENISEKGAEDHD